MSKAEMSRLRIAATAAVEELGKKVRAAEGSQRVALSAQEGKAADLEREARRKEIASVLSEVIPGSGVKLTSAADALQAEVERLKQSTSRLTQLGAAIKLGTDAVKGFQAVAQL